MVWFVAARARHRCGVGFPDDATLIRVRSNVVRLLRRRLPCTVDPHDVASDVMLCFVHFRGESSPDTYAHRIARNLIAQHWRAHERRSCVESSDEIERYADTREASPYASELALARREAEELPEFLRDVVGSWLAGMQPGEIAERLGLNANTVRSRLVRGRAVLRERLVDLSEREGWVAPQ